MSDNNDDEKDVVYEQMLSLYHKLIQGNYQGSSRSYFQQITDYYQAGGRMTKIRAIEIVLRILQGRVVRSRPVKTEEERPKGMGIVQYRLHQIRLRMSGKLKELKDDRRDSQHVSSNQEMLAWLNEVLINETDTKILTTYFIFIKSNDDYLVSSGQWTDIELFKLHQKLLENIAYKKLASFDRLWFS